MPFEFSSTYYWLILAVVLAVVEINTSTLVCIWFVVGSAFAFATSFLTDSVTVQMMVFSLVSGICLAVTRPLAKKVLGRKPVPTNADMLIGRICIVTEDILPDRKGRVKAEGLNWLAECETPVEKGRKAKVTAIKGATLVVTPVTEKNPLNI